MVELRQVPGPTGRLLRELLVEKGVPLGTPADAVVSYGVGLQTDKPALNANAGKLHKFGQLQAMAAKGVSVPPHSLDGHGLAFPILGRKFHHRAGRDIIPILQNDREFEWRKAGGASDFFVQYIPRETEYRLWVYRRKVGATYEKVMAHPERYTRIGSNWENGFAFNIVAGAPEELKDVAAAAVDACELDFAAVDVLKGKDGRYYVLECNTAPGVEGVRQGLDFFARKIARWVELNYPARKGTNGAQ